MATVTITLTDVEKDGKPGINMHTNWGALTPVESREPTQAMVLATEFRYQFTGGQLDLNVTLARIHAEAEASVQIKKAIEGDA